MRFLALLFCFMRTACSARAHSEEGLHMCKLRGLTVLLIVLTGFANLLASDTLVCAEKATRPVMPERPTM